MKSAQWHSDTFCNHILISVESVGVMLLGSVCKSVARILLVSGQEAAWPGLGRRECCTVLYLCTIPGTAPLRLKRGLEEKLLQWFSYLTLEDDDFDEWNSSEKDNSRNCRRINDKNQLAHEFCICRLCLRWRGKGSLSLRMCWCFAFGSVFCILLYHPKGWWAYEACRETFEFILCGGRIAETEHQERAWRAPQAGGVDPWQYAALFCLFSLFSCWLDSSDDLRISFSTIKILRCRNRLSFFLTRPWGYSWNGKDDEPTPFTMLRNLLLAATLSATISRTVMWGSSIGSQSGGKGALTILALQAWQFHARLKQGTVVTFA